MITRAIGLALLVALGAGCDVVCNPGALEETAVTPLPEPGVQRIRVLDGDLAGWSVDCPGEIRESRPPRVLRCKDGEWWYRAPNVSEAPVRIDFDTPTGVRLMAVTVTFKVEDPTRCSSAKRATVEMFELDPGGLAPAPGGR